MLDQIGERRDGAADPEPFHARNAAPSGSFWAVAYTQPQAERWAAANLRDQGYPVFLPMTSVVRRDRVIRSLKRVIEVPLFPRYLFVGLDGHWGPAQHTRGVSSLLLNEGRPVRVAQSVVQRLQDLAAPTLAGEVLWRPGAACWVKDGGLRGAPGVVLKVWRHRASVGVMLFGGMRVVSAALTQLARRGTEEC